MISIIPLVQYLHERTGIFRTRTGMFFSSIHSNIRHIRIDRFFPDVLNEEFLSIPHEIEPYIPDFYRYFSIGAVPPERI